MSINVRYYDVCIDDMDITVTIEEYESIEVFVQFLEQEYGENIDGTPVRELWDDESKTIIISGDVWFGKWEVLDK